MLLAAGPVVGLFVAEGAARQTGTQALILFCSRGDNPTVMEFERLVAALEGAEAGRAFSSGMGAISATVLAFVSAGDRIVTIRHVYSDAYRLFELLLSRFGVTVD